MTTPTTKEDQLRQLIENAEDIVFFGGAGVSTESGIPDFRSDYTLSKTFEEFGLSPETILSADFFHADPGTFYRYVKGMLYRPDATPGPAHLALARLERAGKLSAVVTQNIDGLHQKAGNALVLELHGTLATYTCVDCGRTHVGADVMAQLENGADLPKCACAGLLKPDVVLYQEGLPEAAFGGAAAAISEADLLIVAGTSLMVQPAASLLSLYEGEELVIINNTPTPLDDVATLVFREPVGEVLWAAVQEAPSTSALVAGSREFDAVVFDLGNVLVGWEPYGAVQEVLTPEEWDSFTVDAGFSALNQRADAGESPDDLVAELSASDPGSGAILRQYFEGFPRALTGPVPGSAQIVRELNQAGQLTLGLTNWAAETFVHAAQSAPVIEELQGVVVSGRVGFAKPDRAIFEHLLSTYDLDASKTIFVDDSPTNVEAARELGLHAILFEDAAGLRTELRDLGVRGFGGF